LLQKRCQNKNIYQQTIKKQTTKPISFCKNNKDLHEKLISNYLNLKLF